MHDDDERQDAARTAEHYMAKGELCPNCAGNDTESNGGTEYRCRHCDHRWGFDHGERYGF